MVVQLKLSNERAFTEVFTDMLDVLKDIKTLVTDINRKLEKMR